MQTTTTTKIKQNISSLQDALRGDLLVTKQNKPFVVVMDYQKYQSLTKNDNVEKDAPEEVYQRIGEALAEVRLMLDGKLPKKSALSLLDEI